MHENILLKQEAEKVGFWALPPTVDEFLDYIGLKDNVYEYWKTHLRSIFPDNIHVSNNYVLLTGAIGTGKSTVSKISALYTLCRLLMLKNLDYFHLTITKPIQFLFFHVKIEKARAEFVSYVEEIVQTNKFFRYLINERKKVKDAKPMPFQFVSDGARSNSSIGGDVLFYVFSEANFVNENVISFKIDQAYKRFKSRFLAAMPYMGNIIIDTSASFEGAISDVLSDKDDFYTVRASQWDVKPFLYFKKGHFLVYTGGIDTGAKILHEDEDLSKYESGKIIKVPKELEREFKSNIHTALLDLAGLNIRAPNAIFNTEILSDVVNKENYFPDTDIIFNLPNYCDLLKKILDSNAYYYMHVDTSIKGDNTGIALATWKSDNKIHIDFCCGLHNNGEEIPMYIIQEFIEKMLKLGINIHKVSADSFQSYKLLQDITRIYRIQTQIINIDSMPSVYFALKKSVIDKSISIVNNKALIKELIELKLVLESAKPKVDHPSTGSKDIADAVACANWICIEDAKKSNFIVPTSNFDEILLNYKLRSKMKLNNPSLLNNSTNIVGQIMSNIYQEENDQTGNSSK